MNELLLRMSITLSPPVVHRVREFVAAREDAIGLRLGVKRSGCSGWSYVAEVADSVQSGDTRFDQDGVCVLVDADALALIDGTEVDLERDGLNSRFVFRNPNVTAECGCGTSFTTDDRHADPAAIVTVSA